MLFIANSEKDLESFALQKLLRTTSSPNGFVDAWVNENGASQAINQDNFHLTISENGIFGLAEYVFDESKIADTAYQIYHELFTLLEQYSGYTLLRVWNYIPNILKENCTFSNANNYQQFNAGRFKAFKEIYPALDRIPAASAVGVDGEKVRIEFLAVKSEVVFLENKDQVPSKDYSEKYGILPPLFSRGAIYKNINQTILITSGTASVVGEDSKYMDLYDQVNQSIQNLRVLGSQFNLKSYAIDYGFALEDAVLLRIYYKHDADRPFLQKYLRKIVSPDCKLSFMKADICREELLVEIEGVLIKKGEFESKDSGKYQLKDNRIRTESFEIHIAEHCNLRCKECCNISPFQSHKFMSLEEVENICGFLKDHIQPDVFKIAGGEPTLHPQIDDIIRIVKNYRTAKQLRVVSNGLLIHKMSEYFWQTIDQLTISNYQSAPVKPKTLDLIKSKARQYGIVLNIKFVDQFNEIFVEEPIEDQSRLKAIYNDCWMRHRCHMIRNGYFYKCTRAAYMNDYFKISKKDFKIGTSTYSEEDGISIKDPDFKRKALEYLSNSKPLYSCHYCLGVSGKLIKNVQLSKKEINNKLFV